MKLAQRREGRFSSGVVFACKTALKAISEGVYLHGRTCETYGNERQGTIPQMRTVAFCVDTRLNRSSTPAHADKSLFASEPTHLPVLKSGVKSAATLLPMEAKAKKHRNTSSKRPSLVDCALLLVPSWPPAQLV